MDIVALVPAYNPSEQFVSVVRELAASDFAGVIVVNDGSDPEYDRYFSEIRTLDKVCLLRHAVNLGKGAALKNGLNHAYCHFGDLLGVVTSMPMASIWSKMQRRSARRCSRTRKASLWVPVPFQATSR